ncbi:MAG: hypothetical protein ACKOX6_11290 [Bdellovibrio sp.]
MKSRKKIFFTISFWGGAFGVAVFLFALGMFQQEQKDQQKERVLVLHEMSHTWLKEAKMDQRISVKTINLKRNEDNKLTAVKVTLDSPESYNYKYKAQLLTYLAKRASTETGIKVHFAFVN